MKLKGMRGRLSRYGRQKTEVIVLLLVVCDLEPAFPAAGGQTDNSTAAAHLDGYAHDVQVHPVEALSVFPHSSVAPGAHILHDGLHLQQGKVPESHTAQPRLPALF